MKPKAGEAKCLFKVTEYAESVGDGQARTWRDRSQDRNLDVGELAEEEPGLERLCSWRKPSPFSLLSALQVLISLHIASHLGAPHSALTHCQRVHVCFFLLETSRSTNRNSQQFFPHLCTSHSCEDMLILLISLHDENAELLLFFLTYFNCFFLLCLKMLYSSRGNVTENVYK